MAAETESAADEWIGRHRRSPRLTDRSFLCHRPLSAGLRSEIDRRADALGVVVDVGCGGKPYLPWFEGRVDRFVGLDVGGAADALCFTEALPLKDGVADLVLCTQVLEHVYSPERTVREIGRILKPGGAALVSTHGVQPYHPVPTDFWRWTGAGLEKVFVDSGEFSRVEIHPCGGTVATLGYLLALYVSLVGDKVRQRRTPLRRPAGLGLAALVAAINATALRLDERVGDGRHPERPNSLSPNYLVVAVK